MEGVNMNKLNIVQSSNNVETVTTLIINQLYNAALSVSEPEEGETDQAYMSGHISVDHAYDAKVKYLAGTIGEGSSGVVTSIQQNAQGRFQDLRIDVTNGLFISFADPNVESVCASNWGSNNHITRQEAAAVTTISDKFKNNADIVNFDEFKYFTGVTEINSQAFVSCTNLQHVSLPQSCTTLGAGAFQNCPSLQLSATDLQYVENIEGNRDSFLFTYYNQHQNRTAITSANLYLPNLKEVGFGAFKGQTNIQTVNLPALTKLHAGAVFAYCTNLTTVTSLGSITSLDWFDTVYGYRYGIFEECVNLTTVNLPNTLIELGDDMFMGCVNLVNIDFSHIVKIGERAFLGMNGAQNKVMYLPNVTKINSRGVFANSSNMHIYLPGNLQFVRTTNNGNSEVASNPSFSNFWPANLFSDGMSRISTGNWNAYENNCRVNTVYFRDVTAFPAGQFIQARIKTVIINNTTIPSLTATTDSELTSRYSDVNDCILSQINDTVLESVYVPDSALTAYQNSPLFANVSSKIKALSTCPRITVAQAESGSTGVIADYM